MMRARARRGAGTRKDDVPLARKSSVAANNIRVLAGQGE